ncbi:MAG TPA: hypothetical protein VEE83_03515 [Thermoplasmata archaeon]|nr:hypothetical protein [Thermoplasmata archaeon]
MRIRIRPRLPVLALMLLAPGIPELLTGSTPVSELVFNPFGFVVGFSLDVALYGCGALLIREFAVAYHKGWGSILLLGAAYGIAEEGFEVHTFFQPTGSPVGALGSYGHLFGVNWLWALALTVFHATYSIALPILLTRLWFPSVKEVRWLDRGAVGLTASVFVAEVVGFGFLVGHGPSLAALGFFVALVALLVGLAVGAPRDLLSVRPGPRRVGRNTLVALGAVEFTAYVFVLLFSATRLIPAVGAGLFLVVANAAALLVLLRTVGSEDLERSEFLFAVGMLSVLFVWDVVLEFILVPGILAVTAVFVYLLIRLDRTLKSRTAPSTVPPGAGGPPLAGV